MPPRKRKKEGNTWGKVFAVIIALTVITISVIAFYYYEYEKDNNEYHIDSIKNDTIDTIDFPHLTGNTTVEVDYMENCKISQSDFDEISTIFEEYGIYIRFILDEEIPYDKEVSDVEISTYYATYRNQNRSSYMLIASKHSEKENTLGGVYHSEKIVIFKDVIHSAFGDTYEDIAIQYVIMHEMGHTYGAGHSDVYADIMYPYISQRKLVLYPEPEFHDEESLAEFLD